MAIQSLPTEQNNLTDRTPREIILLTRHVLDGAAEDANRLLSAFVLLSGQVREKHPMEADVAEMAGDTAGTLIEHLQKNAERLNAWLIANAEQEGKQ